MFCMVKQLNYLPLQNERLTLNLLVFSLSDIYYSKFAKDHFNSVMAALTLLVYSVLEIILETSSIFFPFPIF